MQPFTLSNLLYKTGFAVVIVHQGVRPLVNFDLIMELLRCSIEICWPAGALPHRFHGWRGATCVKAPARSGKGGSDGTANKAQRACCHCILRLPDRRRLRHVLSLDAARGRSQEAGIGRATYQGAGTQVPAPLSCEKHRAVASGGWCSRSARRSVDRPSPAGSA